MTVTFSLAEFWQGMGLSAITWQQCVMILISCELLYLAIAKEYEPLLLLPIAFGMLLANLPLAGLESNLPSTINGFEGVKELGLLQLLYMGVKLGIYPPLIFLGIGCMTDFSPLIANPKSMLLGAAAQLGVYVAFFLALMVGFSLPEAGAIGIIGGADGPTAIYVTSKLAPSQLPSSFLSSCPMQQPWSAC